MNTSKINILLKGFILPIIIFCSCVPTATAKLNQSYYGTNYTVPFAHAFRALQTLGIDHHKAIDRDVYHLGRLGLNAFRLHLWDVEISDSIGNLLDNEHLEMLDYLIAAVEKEGMKVMLTAQTNFGNGYPERNTDPNNAFTYEYDKCQIHDDPNAQDAQERYLRQLVGHKNRYTGKTYAEDPDIIMMEINNEPCHSGTEKEITAYINRMANALRDSGWNKDIVYNVSHNLDRTKAFYDADIDGTTYQWYPTGLVHGQQRKGNFLTALDEYNIPFDTISGFDSKTKVIYEYDPGDVLDTYLYPAAARTFRKAGFEWITQFAYDPIDMARFNSEYQTHFLNLAYTPGKAIGMAIAAEVTRQIPKGKDFGKYPQDTVFGDFHVSARKNLAMLNDGIRYYHTNSTDRQAKNYTKLKTIKGVGNSPMVITDGTGAYFIDKLDNDTWRLEVMPDVIITDDPFKRPSLKRSVAFVSDSPIKMSIDLPGLNEGFSYKGKEKGVADDKNIEVIPGTYILSSNPKAFEKWTAESKFEHGLVGDYVMPPLVEESISVINHTPSRLPAGSILNVNTTIVGSEPIDSVKIFPADVNFWRADNDIFDMKKSGKYEYSASINLQDNPKMDTFKYNIVVYSGDRSFTFPGTEDGNPLDWDFAAGRVSGRPLDFYTTKFTTADTPIVLYDATSGYDATDMEINAVSKYVGDIMTDYQDITGNRRLSLTTESDGNKQNVRIGLVSRDGFTYSACVEVSEDGTAEVSLDRFIPSDTYNFPQPYPAFIHRTYTPDFRSVPAFDIRDLESVTVSADKDSERLPIELQTIIIY